MFTRTLVVLVFFAATLRAAANPGAEAALKRAHEEEKYARWASAADSYKTALSYEPSNPQTYRGLGYAYYHLGLKANCIQAYEHYLQLVPGDKVMADYVKQMKAALPAAKASGEPVAKANAPLEVVQWHKLKGAEADSKSSGKPLLYFFGGDWAPASRRLTRQVFAKSDTAHWINEHFIPVSIEVPRLIRDRANVPYDESRLLSHYVITAVPTLVVEYPDGRAAEVIHGSKKGVDTMKKLEELVNKSK
jgi:tetratricopeptide (TPR) repeat protein